jgi:hypothetical protein
VQSDAVSVSDYLAELPEDRRTAVAAVREAILESLPEGYEEVMDGMIVYVVPHTLYPKGYHVDPRQPLPFVELAAQKRHIAVYLMSLYMDAERERAFREDWMRSGKKLDLGKSCLRFTRLENVHLPALRRVIASTPVAAFV